MGCNLDIPALLRTLIKINYSRVASFEHEKDENDPLAGLAESVGYVRGVLAAIVGIVFIQGRALR